MSTERKKERRLKRRYGIERDVRFRLLSGTQIAENGSGKSVNISSAGVSFTTDRPLALGTIIELTMSWPALLNNSCPMKLMLFGRIVRCDGDLAAMTIERYEFRTQGRALAAPPFNALQASPAV